MKKRYSSSPLLALSAPAYAQLGGLGGALNKAQQAQDAKTEARRPHLLRGGGADDRRRRQRQGPASASASSRTPPCTSTSRWSARRSPGSPSGPNLPWTFIVLDTDGVNAFASPGGFVHITRGALGLIKNEAELAGVLGHEIGHVTRKHTINAIRKSKAVKLGASVAREPRRSCQRSAIVAYDKCSRTPTTAATSSTPTRFGVGAAAEGRLRRRRARRRSSAARRSQQGPGREERPVRVASGNHRAHRQDGNGLAAAKTTATVAAALQGERQVPAGADHRHRRRRRRRVWPRRDPARTEKKEEPKKKGFGLGSLKQTVAPEKQSSQVSASGGARGVGPDRAAKGGSNPAVVKAAVTAGETGGVQEGDCVVRQSHVASQHVLPSGRAGIKPARPFPSSNDAPGPRSPDRR